MALSFILLKLNHHGPQFYFIKIKSDSDTEFYFIKIKSDSDTEFYFIKIKSS